MRYAETKISQHADRIKLTGWHTWAVTGLILFVLFLHLSCQFRN